MSRLPQPGSDDGTWGNVLNDFLAQAHNVDGTLKSVPTTNITGLAAVATSGSYTDLTNPPTIPTQASDIGAITPAGVDTKIATQATTDAATYITKPSGGLTSQVLVKQSDGSIAWGSANGIYVLVGAGIDPSGATDSAAAVQTILSSAPDGATIVVPDGATIRCNSGLTVSHRLTFGGAGQLNFYNLNGTGHIAAVLVTADGTSLIGLRIANPSMTVPDTTQGNGNTQFGVLIKANDVLVVACVIDKFQSGIVVDSHGEYERTRIMYNRVSDVLGAGDGASNTTSTNGEDRGDGICNWGSQATIVGNIVNCHVGSDARIGIHTEALPSQEGTTTANADTMATISNNIIFGQFRRGIVTEEVQRVSITANSIADPTWWGIAIVGTANDTVISGNTIKYTRTATDNQGASWSPHHAGIMVYDSNGAVDSAIVANNSIHVVSGATIASGICFTGSNSIIPAFINPIVEGNTIRDESGTMASGIRLMQPNVGARIANNIVNFFQQYGVYLDTATYVSVSNNRLVGPGQGITTSRGIYFNVTANDWQINGNTVTDCDTGIYAINGTTVQVNHNHLARVTTGINGFGTVAPFVIVGNIFASTVTTVLQSVTSNAVQAGNSN